MTIKIVAYASVTKKGNSMKKVALIAIVMTILIYITKNYIVEESSEKIPEFKISSIVSLSPSITREIIDLGSEDLLTGVTSYHPPLTKKIDIVGNLIKPNVEKITMINPDIVLFSKEDNTTQNTNTLKQMNLNYFVFKINNDFDSICENYLILGKILKKDKIAQNKISNYRKQLEKIKKTQGEKKVIFLVSLNPLIAASGNSFIGSTLKYSGAKNVYAHLKKGYPIISIESLVSSKPHIIISMTEGAEIFFTRKLKSFKDIPFMQKRKIFTIKPDNIAYYTPGDFIKAVKIISEIIEKN